MTVLVAGTVTRDTLHLPDGVHTGLGGSALYGALGTSLFAPAAVLGTVGDDVSDADLAPLEALGVQLAGLGRRPGSTFRWEARYLGGLDERVTVGRDLGVGRTPPSVPASLASAGNWICLGSTDPHVQRSVRDQLPELPYTIDTMEHWARDSHGQVVELLRHADTLFVSVSECLVLGGVDAVPAAAAELLEWGVGHVVVKDGSRGAQLFSADRPVRSYPAFPAPLIVDPTGAGDALAGAYTASRSLGGTPGLCLARGIAAASFAAEGLSFAGFERATGDEVARRVAWVAERAKEREGVG